MTTQTVGSFVMSLRRLLSPVFGLVVVGAVAPLPVSEARQGEPLTRREVSRALDLAEDLLDDAEKAVRKGDAEEARMAYASAGGWFLRVLEDYPDRHDVRLELARVYRFFEEWENVADSYVLALAGLEDHDEILEAWTEMTNAYSMMGDDEAVIEAGRMVLEMDLNVSPDLLVAIAGSLARQERYEVAAEMAEEVLALAPDSAGAHSILGHWAAAGGDLGAAETSFLRAVQLDPEIVRAHAGLAEIYFAREDYRAAVEAATEALSRDDRLVGVYGIRGKAHYALGNREEAYGDLAMALTLDAGDPAANFAFAQVYESEGNLSQAADYYERVTQLDNAPPSLRIEASLSIERLAFAALADRCRGCPEFRAPSSEQAAACIRMRLQDFFRSATEDRLDVCVSGRTDIGVRDPEGNTWLHFAALYGARPSVIEALLDTGAQVDARNRDGRTPLHFAAEATEYEEVIHLLAARGAKVDARDLVGRDTPRSFRLDAQISRYGPYDLYDDPEQTPLHRAARYNDRPSIVLALLGAGADLEAQNGVGESPLFATAYGNPKTVGILIAAGAKVRVQDSRGCTALHVAAADNPDPVVTRALLAAGIGVDARCDDGWTPLHHAARGSGNVAVVEALLEAGADPAARTGEGRLAFDLASENDAVRGSPVYWRLNEARFR